MVMVMVMAVLDAGRLERDEGAVTGWWSVAGVCERGEYEVVVVFKWSSAE
jgi:hypothetical protein